MLPVDSCILRSLVGDPDDHSVALVRIDDWPRQHAIDHSLLPGLANLGHLDPLDL